MAKKFDMIKDINEKKETLKLAVRVKDLWFVQNWDTRRHMELILLDQKVKEFCCSLYFRCGMIFFLLTFFCQGSMIPAMVKKEDLGLWEEKLVEGQTYIMHNFKILKNQGQFRVCDHPYKLLFIGATTIK